jgi:limonene-1,2-epoxide hydrolase
MKTNIMLFIGFLVAFSSCQKPALKQDLAHSPSRDLKVSMSLLRFELDQILPYLLNPREFHNPKNTDLIKERLSAISKISRTVTHEPAVKNQDPVLSFLAIGFQDEISRSVEAFNQGHREYARMNMLNVSAYCIECHTRTHSGPSLDTTSVESSWSKMRMIDQLDYLVATRQFERARKLANLITSNGLTENVNVFDLDRATRLGLLITVRYEQNPDHALQLINGLLKAPRLPFYLKSAAAEWKKQVLAWESNAKNKMEPLAQARILAKNTQNEIDMLRIQALLNPIITEKMDPEALGESLYLLGVSYEVTKDIAMWSLHENYFEACIRKLPKSKWANQCYESLEKNIYFGYTGSRGTFIPDEVEQKLKELKKMTTL